MDRLVSFNISGSPIPISIMEKKIQEKEIELKAMFNEFYNGDEIDKFIKIIKQSQKSNRTLIDDQFKSYCWSDELYLKLYDCVMQSHFSIIKMVIDIKMKKFNDQCMPINYVTIMIRSSMEKKSKLFAIIEDDLSSIREFFKLNCGNRKMLSALPPRFLELNLKVNRNENLDEETKKLLNKEINDCHKKVQEWIRKN